MLMLDLLPVCELASSEKIPINGKKILLDKAINNADWCSSDPVCSELGSKQGQGVNNLNGAACYNCSHIPETSCEFWNLYLDRSLLVDEEIGFFKR